MALLGRGLDLFAGAALTLHCSSKSPFCPYYLQPSSLLLRLFEYSTYGENRISLEDQGYCSQNWYGRPRENFHSFGTLTHVNS
jgi:hypothetical protein